MKIQILKKTRVLLVLRVLLPENPRQISILSSKKARHGLDTAVSSVSSSCLVLNLKKTLIDKAFKATRHTRHVRQAKNHYHEKLSLIYFSYYLEKYKRLLFCNTTALFSSTSAPLCHILALLEQTQRGCIYLSKEHQS